jgi:hypothetical protein
MKRIQLSLALCTGLCACAVDSGTGIDAAHHDGYFATVSSNYGGATSVSLLGLDGKVTDAQWVGSKAKNPDLRVPLSDDVVLPTVSYSRRYLTTIERGLGVVTRFDLDEGKVLGQLRTDSSPADDMAAYHSNPQDVYYLDESSAWVSRWAPNPDPSAAARERGTDLIELNPKTMKRTARRIDLSSLDAMVDEQKFDDQGNPTSTESVVAHARPTSLVPAGKFLVVGLARATDGFSYAGGMVAIVDPVAGKLVDHVALDGITNCGAVYPVQDEPSRVLVACTGSWSDAGAAAGIVELEVDSHGQGKPLESFRVADHDGAAVTATPLVSLGKHVVVAVAPGSLDATTKELVSPDVAYRLDLHIGKQTMLWKGTGAFKLGVPAFDAATGMLLLPDAGSDDSPLYGVRRFKVGSDLAVDADGFVKVTPETTLPVREVHRL